MHERRACLGIVNGYKGFRGICVNGYVNINNSGNSESKSIALGQDEVKKINRRSLACLIILSAGGLPAGMAPTICGGKRARRKAGVRKILRGKCQIGFVRLVSHVLQRCVKRDVLFCYDLELGESFVPKAVDGEVESFELLHTTARVSLQKSSGVRTGDSNRTVFSSLISRFGKE